MYSDRNLAIRGHSCRSMILRKPSVNRASASYRILPQRFLALGSTVLVVHKDILSLSAHSISNSQRSRNSSTNHLTTILVIKNQAGDLYCLFSTMSSVSKGVDVVPVIVEFTSVKHHQHLASSDLYLVVVLNYSFPIRENFNYLYRARTSMANGQMLPSLYDIFAKKS